MNFGRTFWIVMTVAIGVLMNPINTTMITVAFVGIQESFEAGFSEVSWLIASYYIISAIAQPLMGKVSDSIGARRVYMFGLLLVCLSSTLAPFSSNMGELTAYRAVQALGTSALHPAGMSLLKLHVSDKQARALGIVGSFSTFSAAIGPSVGGLLIHYSSWKAIFLINYPLIFTAFALVWLVVPRDAAARTRSWVSEMDYAGILLFAAAMTGWFIFFQSLDEPSYLLLSCNLAASLLFYWREIGAAKPFIDIRAILANRRLTLIFMQYAMINIVLYCMLFGLPVYLISTAGLAPGEAGLVMLAMSAPNLAALPFVARWVEQSGPGYPMLAGAAGAVTALLLFQWLDAGTSILVVCLMLVLFGLSNSAQSFSVQASLFLTVDKSAIGVYSGLLQTSRFVGTITSSCVLGVVFGGSISVSGLHQITMLCAAIAAVSCLGAWVAIRRA
ncbi:Methyl viologen resistance protein SmvA [compost metagenome]